MSVTKLLTSEEISAIVDGFDPIDWEEMEMLRKKPLGERPFVGLQKAEMLRADLRNKLIKDFAELSMPEINMKILMSFTSVRMGKNYTEPAYHEHFG